MNVSTVSAKISDVDASLTVPNFYILIDLSTWKQNQVIGWVEADRSNDCLMARQGHLK